MWTLYAGECHQTGGQAFKKGSLFQNKTSSLHNSVLRATAFPDTTLYGFALCYPSQKTASRHSPSFVDLTKCCPQAMTRCDTKQAERRYRSQSSGYPDWHPRLSTSRVTLMYVTGNVSSQGDYSGAWSQRCSCFLLLPVPSQMHLHLFKEKFHLPLVRENYLYSVNCVFL